MKWWVNSSSSSRSSDLARRHDQIDGRGSNPHRAIVRLFSLGFLTLKSLLHLNSLKFLLKTSMSLMLDG